MADDRSSLRGQVGTVTGGGRGIGQAMALALARSGMHVIAARPARSRITAPIHPRRPALRAMLKSVADIRRNDLHALRVVKANEGHVRPILSPPVGADD